MNTDTEKINPVEEEHLLQDLVKEAGGTKHELEKFNSFGRRFTLGVFMGLGTVVGATVVVALLIYILSFFSEVGFVGDFTNWITDTIKSGGPAAEQL